MQRNNPNGDYRVKLVRRIVQILFTIGLSVYVLGVPAAGRLPDESAYYIGASGYDPRQDDPLLGGRIYDGSTSDEFDDILRRVPEGSTIYFGRHVFETSGVWDMWLNNEKKGFRVKSNWKLIGAGTNSVTGTVLKLVDVPVDATGLYNLNVVLSTGAIGQYRADQPRFRRPNVNNLEIRDLQIDCNYSELVKIKQTPALHLAGIQLLGNRGVCISNVLVRHAASKKVDSRGQQFECFQVYLYNKWAEGLNGDYQIDRVAVADYYGGYTSGICVNGVASGTIQNCTVDLASDQSARFALNFGAGINHFTIYNNTIRNAGRGINNDTGPVCTFVTIISNRMINCGTGLLLANSQSNQVLGNTIWLNGTGAGISIRQHPTMAHVQSGSCLVRGNVLSGPAGVGISLDYENEFDRSDQALYWSSNNVVQDNVLLGALQNKIPPYSLAPNVVRPGNRRHTGSFPACPRPGEQANLSALGFPSDIGPGSGCAYCEGRAADTAAGYISRVKINGTRLDMLSDWGDGSGYTDFTTGYPMGVGTNKFKRSYYVQWADIRRGRSYQLEISGAGIRDPGSASFLVYVDWDHDGTFSSSRELAALGKGKTSLTANLTCPPRAPLGSTRLRVILGCGRAPGPCEFKTFRGEVEDYTINVLP